MTEKKEKETFFSKKLNKIEVLFQKENTFFRFATPNVSGCWRNIIVSYV